MLHILSHEFFIADIEWGWATCGRRFNFNARTRKKFFRSSGERTIFQKFWIDRIIIITAHTQHREFDFLFCPHQLWQSFFCLSFFWSFRSQCSFLSAFYGRFTCIDKFFPLSLVLGRHTHNGCMVFSADNTRKKSQSELILFMSICEKNDSVKASFVGLNGILCGSIQFDSIS